MNEHDFENSLRSLAAPLACLDPTPEWKAEILSVAHCARKRSAAPTPRWLLATLGTAWVVIVLLRLTTPDSAPLLPKDVRGRAEHFVLSARAGDASRLAITSLQSNLDLLNLP